MRNYSKVTTALINTAQVSEKKRECRLSMEGNRSHEPSPSPWLYYIHVELFLFGVFNFNAKVRQRTHHADWLCAVPARKGVRAKSRVDQRHVRLEVVARKVQKVGHHLR